MLLGLLCRCLECLEVLAAKVLWRFEYAADCIDHVDRRSLSFAVKLPHKGVHDDVSKSIASLPTWAQSLLTTLESDAGKLLSIAVSTAAQDVLKNGLTTASFTSAAKDVATQLTAQGATMGKQIIYSALNAAVAENQTKP